MVKIETKKLKDLCNNLMLSIDLPSIEHSSNLLDIHSFENNLKVFFTNKEYSISTTIENNENINSDLHAVIKADLFLNLITKLSTTEVELSVVDNYLLIRSGGEYKIPIIFEGDSMVSLPEIELNNVINTISIDLNILQSIYKYNSVEMKKKTSITSPLHQLFYIDDLGCITYNSGACVNSFSLEKPIRLIINEKIVKLFNLLKDDNIKFEMGFDSISNNLNQTKIRLSDSSTSISAIISLGDDRINQFPADNIRKRLKDNYPYNMVVDRNDLLKSIERLKLFNNDNLYIPLEVNSNTLVIYDSDEFNFEKLSLLNNIDNLIGNYKFKIKISDFEVVLKSCIDKYLTIEFGNNQSIVIDRKNIKNILPEVIGGN